MPDDISLKIAIQTPGLTPNYLECMMIVDIWNDSIELYNNKMQTNENIISIFV